MQPGGAKFTPPDAANQFGDIVSAEAKHSDATWVAIASTIVLACILLASWKFWKADRLARENLRRLDAARNLIETEISAQAGNLRIRKLQLVSSDIYGTYNYGLWLKEVETFYTTRIERLLMANNLQEYSALLRDGARVLIEVAAEREPVSPAATFHSSPEIYDPRMTPIDYEIFCAQRLREGGWESRTTVATGDQGADVIAVRNGIKLVVQCKLYGQPIGNDAVQQVYAAMKFQAAQVAAVVSNQPYTRSARQLAETNGVRLLHHDQLAQFQYP